MGKSNDSFNDPIYVFWIQIIELYFLFKSIFSEKID